MGNKKTMCICTCTSWNSYVFVPFRHLLEQIRFPVSFQVLSWYSDYNISNISTYKKITICTNVNPKCFGVNICLIVMGEDGVGRQPCIWPPYWSKVFFIIILNWVFVMTQFCVAWLMSPPPQSDFFIYVDLHEIWWYFDTF